MTGPSGADGGNPDGAAGGEGDQGQTPGTEGLFAELDEATRDWVLTRHENDVGKLAKQAYELDKFAGSAIQVPKDDATSDEWSAFYGKLGRPEEASKYDFKPPENLPDTVPYNEKLATEFRDTAHEMGLTQKQASSLHDWFAGQQVSMAEAMQDKIGGDLQVDIDAANAALKDAWGEPGGETYKANLELAGRFFDAIDEKGNLSEVLSKKGLLGPDREVLIPELAFAFAKAGTAIFTEGGTLNGDGDNLTGVNPFEGEVHLTNAMALVKADPDKARMLAKAAGVNLAEYGL